MASVFPDVDAVAIGASAGGVDALLALLPRLAAPSPLVLVVLHRGPRQSGAVQLAALLARVCALPVAEAWDRQPLVAGQVVLAPADYHLLVDPGPVAALSTDEPVLWSRPAIDPLLESAARAFGPRLLAIVLTGASADGAIGAQHVRRRGGELWVQDPAEASAPTMPRAALAAAGADRVMTIDAMGRCLASWGRRESL
jgi:two-component system chemotaxis response regulator CheB